MNHEMLYRAVTAHQQRLLTEAEHERWLKTTKRIFVLPSLPALLHRARTLGATGLAPNASPTECASC